MRIAIIGCGVMGSAFAKHFAKKQTLALCDHHHEHALALAKEVNGEAFEHAKDAVKGADVIVLAVKPRDLQSVSESVKGSLSKHQLLISILAGTPVSLLKNSFPGCTVLRVLPNLAITSGEGVLGLVDDPSIDNSWRKKIETLFHGIGWVDWMPEDKIDALTALTGSGPAFIFVLVEAMIDSGVLLGFTHQEAREFALRTIQGSVALLKETGKTPSELKWQVASPKGTTIAGLKALEDWGFKTAITNAFVAAYQRAKEMHQSKN